MLESSGKGALSDAFTEWNRTNRDKADSYAEKAEFFRRQYNLITRDMFREITTANSEQQ